MTLLTRVKKARETFREILIHTNSVNEIANELANTKKLREYVKEIDDELKEHWGDLATKANNLMEQQDLETFTTKEGVKISIDFQVRGKVENSVEFFFWLETRGDGELGKLQLAPHIVPDNIKEIIRGTDHENVKLAVHWKRLASYIKDTCDPLDAKTWPDGVTVEAWPDIRLNLKGV